MLYVPRARWGSSQSDPAGSPVGIQTEIVIHHTWRPHVTADATQTHEQSIVRAIQDYHLSKGWDDIGYSFLVFQSERAYEGRGWFRTGAHAKGANHLPSICFVINGDDHVPSDGAWDMARRICADGVRVGALTPGYRVSGHHDYSTKSCPGVRTYPLIGRLAGARPPTLKGLVMRQGDTGEDVLWWQHRLNEWTDVDCELTGTFDAQTVAATKAWQKGRCAVTGEVTLATLGTLLETRIGNLVTDHARDEEMHAGQVDLSGVAAKDHKHTGRVTVT